MPEGDLVHDAVVVPLVGEAISEATLVNWVSRIGDNIAKGDVLFTVDTEKVEIENESFVAGTLIEILVPDGGAVMPGQIVGVVAVQADQVPFDADVVDSGDFPGTRVTAISNLPQPTAALPAVKGVSPLARRRARELGVDLDELAVRIDGPVTFKDFEAHSAMPTSGTETGRTDHLDGARVAPTDLAGER